jgi:hypothetical protein
MHLMAKQLIHLGKDNKNMDIQLIHGEFNSKEALELITQMVQIKIKYHENKILKDSSEEDIKYRESKIKRLQMDLFELRETVNSNGERIKIESIIKIEDKRNKKQFAFHSNTFINN